MKSILTALGLVLALIAPASAQAITDGWINITDPVLKPTGNHIIARHYLVWDGRPNCAQGQTARLVVALHGGAGSAEGMATMLVAQGCYVVVYPSGSNKPLGSPIQVSGTNLSWNASSVTPQGWAENNGVNDDLFIGSLITSVKATYSLATTFGAGLSKGGMLMMHLACDAGTFAALAGVSTTISDPTCFPAAYVPDLHIHGDDDHNVCWSTWFASCDPWPKAQPPIAAWQNHGTGHELHVIAGGVHGWNPGGYDSNAAVWTYLNGK